MAIPFVSNINLNQNEIQNAKFQILSTDPVTPVEGLYWYNSTEKVLKYYNGTTVVALSRAFDIHTLAAATEIANDDEIPLYDTSAGANKKLLWATIITKLNDVYDAKGAAAGVLGTNADDAATATVYGVKALANTKVASVGAGNNGIVIGGSETAPTAGVKLSSKAGNSLSLQTGSGEEGLFVSAPASDTYSMVKQATAEAGYIATYSLTKNGSNVGATINIPKDYLVKSAEINTVATVNVPYQGVLVGDKYIDFVINTYDAQAGTGTESHIYLPVNELVDEYVAGDGIDVDASNVISIDLSAANANGLYLVGATAGQKELGLALATASAPGAMSAAQATKLAGIADAATKTEASANNGNIKINNVETIVYTAPSNMAKKYTEANGALTPSGGVCSWVVTHNLNSRAVVVGVAQSASPYSDVMCEIEHTTVNTATIKIVSAASVAANTYTATVIG